MKEIIKNSLDKSISYPDYIAMVKQLAENNATTGTEKTESLIEYTKLNDRRMKRWHKNLKIGQENIERLEKFNKKVTWLILTESWCGDAAHVMPVMQKIADINSNIDIKVVLRDENDELMNAFLTNGVKAIPKVIMIDEVTGDVFNSYGPRPSNATQLVNEYKAKHGLLTPEFKEDLQHWYNKDKGQTAVKDLITLLEI